jgi:hypothetical protein
LVIFAVNVTSVVLVDDPPCQEHAMKVWIDPPSGWRWGFPKIYDRIEDGNDVQAWLLREGYPQSEIDSLGEQFYWRSWEASSDEARKFRPGIPTRG